VVHQCRGTSQVLRCDWLRRYLREAEQAVDPKQRLDLLTQHVLDVWLWTLAQVIAPRP